MNADGITGYNVDLDHPGALEERMITLLSDPARARTMGRNGFDRWHEHFMAWREVSWNYHYLPVAAAASLALLGSTLFALVAGAMVVRARPLPFAMLTLALAQMLKSATTLQAARSVTGGDDGLTMTFTGTLFGLSQSQLAKAATLWPLAWVALCGVVLIAWLAQHSRFGQVLRATQANEERMRFSGFDTYVPRLAAFVLASFIVSVGGLLMALNSAFASPELLDFATGGHALVAMPFMEARINLADVGGLFGRDLVVEDLRIAAAGIGEAPLDLRVRCEHAIDVLDGPVSFADS